VRIVSVPCSNEWIVLAGWYGEERVVERGDVFKCLRFVAQEGK
jgi:hypothetical protein